MPQEQHMTKLVSYLKKNLKKGYTENSLKFALMDQGYSRSAIEVAIKKAHKELAQSAPILKEKPKISYQIIDEHNRPVEIKKSWWQKLFG